MILIIILGCVEIKLLFRIWILLKVIFISGLILFWVSLKIKLVLLLKWYVLVGWLSGLVFRISC